MSRSRAPLQLTIKMPNGVNPDISSQDLHKGALKASAILKQMVYEKMPSLVRGQLHKAEGLLFADPATAVFDTKTGKPIRAFIYSKEPDSVAYKNLIEQAIGKPKESIEVSGTIGMLQVVLDLQKTHDETINKYGKNDGGHKNGEDREGESVSESISSSSSRETTRISDQMAEKVSEESKVQNENERNKA